MHTFQCQNVLLILLYILFTGRINTFRSKSIEAFWSGGIITKSHKIELKNHTKKIAIFIMNFFQLYHLFIMISCVKMCWNSHFTYCLLLCLKIYILHTIYYKICTTWLTKILCYYLPPTYLLLTSLILLALT